MFVVFLASFLFTSLTTESGPIETCTDRCWWDFTMADCTADGNGAFCLDMKFPNPYSTLVPCKICNIIKPGD